MTGDNDHLVHQGDPRLGTLMIVTAAQFLVTPGERSASESGDEC